MLTLRLIVSVSLFTVLVCLSPCIYGLRSSSISLHKSSLSLRKSGLKLTACCSKDTPSTCVNTSPSTPTPSTCCASSAKGVPGKSYFNCRFTGVGSAPGSVSMHNNDFEKLLDTNDAWISKRTGIRTRKYIPTGSSLVDLAASSAKEALKMSGIDAASLDLVLCATSSPDDLFGDAPHIAAAIGATKAAAFDITAACSGFVTASVAAAQFLQTNSYKRACVIGCDALSRYLDWNDRGSCILFGDGAGAMIIESSDVCNQCGDDTSNNNKIECCGEGCSDHEHKLSGQQQKQSHSHPHYHGLLGFAMHSDGVRGQHLSLPFVHNFTEIGDKTTIKVDKGAYGKITMNGAEVYKFAVNEVPAVVAESLRNAGLPPQSVDWLVLHQANTRIIDHVASEMGLPKEKVLSNIDEFGNTSAGSIPLLFDQAVRQGKIKKGDIVAIAGFGAGLSWSSMIIKWG